MLPTPTLHTDRLSLHPMTPDDAADLHRIYADERAMRFMPTPPHTDVTQTRGMIIHDIALAGGYTWAIRRKDDASGRVIGQVNYLGEAPIPGMGYLLHPDFWGQGYTAEACRPALDFGFDDAGYDRVELWIDETNTASLRVAQKLGFGVKGRIAHKYRHKDRHHAMLVWGMTAAQWRGDPAPASSTPAPYAVEPVLMVHDLQASAAHYQQRLGFHLGFLYGDPPTHGGVWRGEWTSSQVFIQLAQVPPEREITPAGYLHIRVNGPVDALHAEMKGRGAQIIAEPTDQPWGFREFAVQDIDGHRLVFASLR